MATKTIKLEGRVFFTFDIEAVTGLHIGGSDTGIEIGGVDKTVIRDKLSNRPYIPGSSLKGKMRSLVEKYRGLKQNQPVGGSTIHSCGAEYKKPADLQSKGRQEYLGCDVCQIYGVPGERDFGIASPTRLVVRDVLMSDDEAKRIQAAARTDLPFTEVKTEVSIDRVTSAANPRQMERVPASTVFGRAEMVYSLYSGDGCDPYRDIARLRTVVEGMQLLEDDYLGGQGSRGSGKVRFKGIQVSMRSQENYLNPAQTLGKDPYPDLAALVADLDTLQEQIQAGIGPT